MSFGKRMVLPGANGMGGIGRPGFPDEVPRTYRNISPQARDRSQERLPDGRSPAPS